MQSFFLYSLNNKADDASANQRGDAAFHVLEFLGGFRRKASLDCFFVFFVVKIFCCGLRPRPGIVFGCVVLACTPRGVSFAYRRMRNYVRFDIIPGAYAPRLANRLSILCDLCVNFIQTLTQLGYYSVTFFGVRERSVSETLALFQI